MIDHREQVACEICHSTDLRTWVQTRDRGYGSFDVVVCDRCAVAFVNPRPTEDAMGAYYADDYYAYGGGARRGLAVIKDLLSDVIASGYYAYPPTSDRHALSSRTMRRLLSVMAYPVRHSLMRLPPYIHQGKLLDIGCATGRDLDFAKDRGWLTYGVEISPKAAAIAQAKGHNVFVGRLPEASYGDGFFDAVMLWDVLEHLHHPLSVLNEISRILKPGGVLVGKALNIRSVQASLFRDKWWPGMDVPRHLYFYTPRSLRSYLHSAGLAMETMSFFSSPRCLSECFDLIWCDAMRRPLWSLPRPLRLLDDVVAAPWAPICDLLGIGDVLIFRARKAAGE